MCHLPTITKVTSCIYMIVMHLISHVSCQILQLSPQKLVYLNGKPTIFWKQHKHSIKVMIEVSQILSIGDVTKHLVG